MSDVPQARDELEIALNRLDDLQEWVNGTQRHIDLTRQQVVRALSLMTREPAVRCAKRKHHVRITKELIREVISLAQNSPDMTIHDIADVVGLRNSGRVSEILTGKRDADSFHQ